MSLDDFVLSPRRVSGVLYAERLADGSAVKIDVRLYDRTPLVYRGRPVWAHVDAARAGLCAQSLYEAIRYRESQQVNGGPGALVFVEVPRDA